jgi:hypothetical protein
MSKYALQVYNTSTEYDSCRSMDIEEVDITTDDEFKEVIISPNTTHITYALYSGDRTI